MEYTLDWYTHDDPDEVDFYIHKALGEESPGLDSPEMEQLAQNWAHPFYEIKWNVTWNSETGKVVVNSIDGKELAEPLVLREPFNA